MSLFFIPSSFNVLNRIPLFKGLFPRFYLPPISIGKTEYGQCAAMGRSESSGARMRLKPVKGLETLPKDII
jgi:hypothetical protein